MDSIPQKQCRKCGIEYPANTEHFHRDKTKPDGLVTICKGCAKIKKRLWYVDNQDHAIQYSTQWIADNYEYKLSYNRDWRKLNPEKIKQYETDWKFNHRSVYLIGKQRRYALHAEDRREKTKDWRIKNPSKVRLQWKIRQSRKRSADGLHTASDLLLLHEDQHGMCAYCGIRLFDEYHVDHVIPLSRGGSNWPDNLALACEHCNLSKKDKFIIEWQIVRGW